MLCSSNCMLVDVCSLLMSIECELVHKPDNSPALPLDHKTGGGHTQCSCICHPCLQVAPAMNTLMWSSPFTKKHLEALVQLGAVVVPPVSKRLACGDTGAGAMASPEAITQVVQAVLQRGRHGRLPASAYTAGRPWPEWVGLAAVVGFCLSWMTRTLGSK